MKVLQLQLKKNIKSHVRNNEMMFSLFTRKLRPVLKHLIIKYLIFLFKNIIFIYNFNVFI
jgi:hypothetical protein